MDEDRQVPEDQDESENGEDDNEKDEEWCEEEVSSVQCTVYPEGPSCLPSQTMGEETTSDSSNSEESSLVHNESQSLATRPSRRGKSFTIRRNVYAARRDAVKRMFFFCRVTRREDRTWFYFLRRVAAQSLRLIVN